MKTNEEIEILVLTFEHEAERNYNKQSRIV